MEGGEPIVGRGAPSSDRQAIAPANSGSCSRLLALRSPMPRPSSYVAFQNRGLLNGPLGSSSYSGFQPPRFSEKHEREVLSLWRVFSFKNASRWAAGNGRLRARFTSCLVGGGTEGSTAPRILLSKELHLAAVAICSSRG